MDAGHRRAATVGRVEMSGTAARLTRFRVYAPAAIAGIGTIPDTILDRSVVVRMRRRAPDEFVREYRERITRPEGEALREQLAQWCAHIVPRVGEPWPAMPAGVVDRPADVWEPLITIADLAGGGWPHLAREACKAFVTGARDDTETVGIGLLRDLREIWPRVSGTSGTTGTPLASTVPVVPDVPDTVAGLVPGVATDELLTRLHRMDESPWAARHDRPALDSYRLSKLLRPYEVKPGKIRLGERSVRGYHAADLSGPWNSYL
jgi:Protein of unknown function (DUF3631)